MKTIKLNLSLEFDGELTQEQQMQVAHNVNCAIIAALNGQGIAPEDSEVLTNKSTLTSNDGIISVGQAYPSQVVTGTQEDGDQLATVRP
jgi:hypothetical protein